MLPALTFTLSTLFAKPRGPYFAANASQHLEKLYWPAWASLFIEEGSSSYPMPRASEVPDLLDVLKGVKGTAVHTDPGTTVTEGQGYAMFVAGMRNDTATLKKLAVAWQANGQGIAGVPACGGCGVNYVCAIGARPSTAQTQSLSQCHSHAPRASRPPRNRTTTSRQRTSAPARWPRRAYATRSRAHTCRAGTCHTARSASAAWAPRLTATKTRSPGSSTSPSCSTATRCGSTRCARSPRSSSRTSAPPTRRPTRGRCPWRARSRRRCRRCGCGAAARAGVATTRRRPTSRRTATCASTRRTFRPGSGGSSATTCAATRIWCRRLTRPPLLARCLTARSRGATIRSTGSRATTAS